MHYARHLKATVHADMPASYLKKCSEDKELFCLDCQQSLIFKECSDKQNHFSHQHSDCSFPFREPESIEHESGKMKISHWLSGLFGEEDVKVEHKIQLTNQRSDVYVPSLATAFEFQCSPIRAKTWEKRADLYRSADIASVWILGYSMHSYTHPENPYLHKLNELEKAVLSKEGKIVYFDTLTEQFVFLYSESDRRQGVLGKEYFFKPKEVSWGNHRLSTRFDPFIQTQLQRKKTSSRMAAQAKETDRFIRQIKEKVAAEEILATKKQISYIQFLLRKNNRTIPYKLHGIRKKEATQLISELTQT